MLVRAHQDAAVRLAASVAGGWGDPEAVVQDAFVKAFRSLDAFRPGSAFRPWLLSIVVNEARNARRSAVRHRHRIERFARAQPRRDGVSAERHLLDADEHRVLVEAVRRLPRRHREAVACRYFLELSEAETAAVLGVPRGTVKSRLARALRRLRADLAAMQEADRPEEVT